MSDLPAPLVPAARTQRPGDDGLPPAIWVDPWHAAAIAAVRRVENMAADEVAAQLDAGRGSCA